MSKPQNPFSFKEETEKGDVARSLQELIASQYISKNFEDIFGSTRLSGMQVNIIARMFIVQSVSEILSVNADDIQTDNLEDKEMQQLKMMFELKKRAYRNSLALISSLYYSFLKMYGLALQSLEGMSRQEGVNISGGATQKLLDGNELGFFDKMRRSLAGKIRYVE